MTTPHEAPKKRQLPTVYTLLFIIIAMMLVRRYPINAEEFERIRVQLLQRQAAAS